MRIAVVGDFHYPQRCSSLILLEELKKVEPELIIGTGDYTSQSVIKELEKLTEFKGVCGNVDDAEINLPPRLELEIKGWKIAVFHSNEIYPRGDPYGIYAFWKDKKPDIILFGHTHKPFFCFMGDCYLLNPGSFNGVISGEGVLPNPSFAVLEIEKESLNVTFISKRRE